MRRYLVIGNQTLSSEELLAALLQRANRGPSHFHLLVPATHPHGSWSSGSARAEAEGRLAAALARFQGVGLDMSGEVGDPNPVAAAGDVLIADPAFDEIVLSTLPPGPSNWLGQGVPKRLAREHPHLPLTHVVGALQPVG